MASSSHVDAIANATIAWVRSGRFDGRCIYATVAPYDLSGAGPTYEDRRKAIQDEIRSISEIPSIRTYLTKDLSDMDVALAGLGMVIPPEFPPNKRIRLNRLNASNLLASVAQIRKDDVRQDGALGEMGYCYFDENGEGDNNKWRFYLTAGDYDEKLRGIGFYRDMVRRKLDVIVSAGTFKEPAIHAALKGELFNVWFTNEHAARIILEKGDAV